MQKRLPKGTKCIVALDSCALSALVSIENFLENNPFATFESLPAGFFFKNNGRDVDEDIIFKAKLTMYGVYKCAKQNYVKFFISPTVLNEISDIRNPDYINQHKAFMEKYCLMPEIEKLSSKNMVLVGQQECSELANLYCSPYEREIIDRTTNEKKTITLYAPMDSNPDPLNIYGPRRPKDDAYIMAYASIYRLSLLTLDGKDFVFVPGSKSVDKRRQGIIKINQDYFKEKCYMQPYIPQDIADSYINFYKTKKMDTENFFSSLNRFFDNMDLGYFENADTILSKLNLDNFDEIEDSEDSEDTTLENSGITT